MTKKVLIIGLNYSGALSGRINIAVGEGMSSIAKSTDGNTWTAAGTKGGITDGRGVAYGKDGTGAGLWVAVGEGGIIAKSTDGNTWTAAGTKGGITDNGYGVSFNSELFIH